MAKNMTISEYDLPIDNIIGSSQRTVEGKVAVLLKYGQVRLRLLLKPRDAERMANGLSAMADRKAGRRVGSPSSSSVLK